MRPPFETNHAKQLVINQGFRGLSRKDEADRKPTRKLYTCHCGCCRTVSQYHARAWFEGIRRSSRKKSLSRSPLTILLSWLNLSSKITILNLTEKLNNRFQEWLSELSLHHHMRPSSWIRLNLNFPKTQQHQSLVWFRYTDDIFSSGLMPNKNQKDFLIILINSILSLGLPMSTVENMLHFQILM